jgi:hypothetical protein
MSPTKKGGRGFSGKRGKSLTKKEAEAESRAADELNNLLGDKEEDEGEEGDNVNNDGNMTTLIQEVNEAKASSTSNEDDNEEADSVHSADNLISSINNENKQPRLLARNSNDGEASGDIVLHQANPVASFLGSTPGEREFLKFLEAQGEQGDDSYQENESCQENLTGGSSIRKLINKSCNNCLVLKKIFS